MTHKRRYYFLWSILLLMIECFIAYYVHDAVIRPYVGDILVIILLSCMGRILSPDKPKYIGLYMMIVGIVVEMMQGLSLLECWGIQNRVLEILLGATFDKVDILCYVAGGTLFTIIETIIYSKTER